MKLQIRRRHFVLAILAIVASAQTAFCSDVVYIDAPPRQVYTRQQVEAAAKVYGLNLNSIVIAGAGDVARASAAANDPKTVAVILTADALHTPYGDRLLAASSQTNGRTPLMIAGITEETDSTSLKKWSGGAITGCKRWGNDRNALYEVANDKQYTRQLSGAALPLTENGVQYLTLGNEAEGNWLISASEGANRHPVLVHINSGGREVFFSTAPLDPGQAIPPDLFRGTHAFPVLAPQLLFLRYAGGERVWHSPGQYANLTIDDLWLKEPYGHVSYSGLLKQMEEHHFHSTIAFIPWNFDRNESAVVSLFREHPDQYSICVHGNNHEHQEFGPVEGRPLPGQVADIKQALARMVAFKKLTGLTYDPVMVFPHKISPEATLAYLKRYNFWATVNGENVPSDTVGPADPEFALRPATMAFADFPSVRRYSAELPIPDWELAMDAFLGNPMLFYCHESYFATGIGAFNEIADKVNRLRPDTEWRSLGDIAKHLYLEKLRDDGNYDVRLLSSSVKLENKHGHEAVFFLEKREDGAIPFVIVVDGQKQPYELADGWLRLRVPVQNDATREISINYQNDFDLAQIDITKRSWRIAAIRYLSDFRDDEVSRTELGRRFIKSYVAYGRAWNAGFFSGAMLLIVIAGYLRFGRKQRQAERSLSASHNN